MPTPEHRCDPTLGESGSPLTMSRILRLLLAYLDDGDFDGNAAPVLHEIGGCPACLAGALLAMTGVAVGLMPEHGPEVVTSLDQHLAFYLDQLEEQSS